MPKIRGDPKEKMSFNCDPINFKKIHSLVDEKEFSTVTDLINTALAFYFENRNREKDQFENLQKYFKTEQGKKQLKEFAGIAVEEKLHEYKISK
ncbi:MAG: hypothetical protein WC626_13890 [Methanoregula sp.]